MIQPELSSALVPVLDAFERLGAAHFVCGSIASSAHGVPRASLDADVVADLTAGHADTLIDALERDFYVPDQRIRDAIREGTSFSVVHLETMLKVDVFVVGASDLRRRELGRIWRARLDTGRELPVASPEDTVLAKLAWFRRGGEVSERQWTDVIGLLRVAARMDAEYLETGATAHGVSDLLRRALSEADTR
ncbi:MAG: hypothetical protein R2712_25995 [Vicinamibacterales bacterium]